MKQKLSNFFSFYVVPAVFFSILAACCYWLYQREKENRATRKLTHQEILYKKDSLEMEFYKRALEEYYPFNHSKIPTDESNSRIQSTR
jgi:hypothetical protein